MQDALLLPSKNKMWVAAAVNETVWWTKALWRAAASGQGNFKPQG